MYGTDEVWFVTDGYFVDIKLKVEHFPDISASVFCKELYLVCTLLFNNPWVHITEFLSVRIYIQRSLQALSLF